MTMSTTQHDFTLYASYKSHLMFLLTNERNSKVTTKTRNMMWQFLLLSSLLFLVFDSALSSCPSHCGSIMIPFPFGIGQGCYLDKWYEVTCLNSTSSSGQPVPFLPKIDKEIVNISLPSTYNDIRMSYALLRIKIPITSMGCSNEDQEEATSTLNLTGSPFYIGYRNKLVAVGCNNRASFTEVQQNNVGCESTCGTISTLPSFPFSYDGRDTCYEPFCNARNKREETNCIGLRCCQASIPEGIRQLIGVRVERIDGNVTRRGCNVAFLTDEAIALSNITDPQWFHARGYTTVETAWFLQTSNLSFVTSIGCRRRYDYENSQGPLRRETNCQCENVTASEISYTRCACTEGYRGNAHVPGGCKDIDECQEPYGDGSPRCGEGICVNIPGGYRCKAKKTRAIVIGFTVSFSVLILLFGIYWLYKFMKRRRRIMLKKKFFKRNGGLLLEQQVSSTNKNVEKTRIFSSKELEKATDNFSANRVLGQGGQGTVYKGMLVDGRIVAVKKAKVVDEDKLEEFINEVVILSQINHRNIVKLLGCCLETEVPVLIYEFIPNGNLYEYLHGDDESDGCAMTTWEARLRIAVDIAGALAYLHSAASCPIYHRDIKSTNILLDEKYRAKVSDFGTSRSITIDQTHLTTLFAGTIGYMDPEFFQSSQYTDKSDVYSFGVVLVELITGEKAIPVARHDETRGLVVQFVETMKENKVLEIIDGRIKEGEIKIEQVVAVAKLARKCLRMKRKNRPNMREVSSELDRIRLSDQEVDVNEEEEEEEEEEEDAIEIDIEDSWSGDTTNNASPRFYEQPLYTQQTWSI